MSYELTEGGNNYNIHNHLYLEVHGDTFKELDVRSFVTLPGEENIVWVKLQP